jgi:hypothetical protein
MTDLLKAVNEIENANFGTSFVSPPKLTIGKEIEP